MDRETYDLIARRILSTKNFGTVEPREFSDWAILEIERGFESRSLSMLASEFDVKSYWEIEPHFRNSISELGWDFPDDEFAIARFAESTMQKIVDEEVAPLVGCRILCDICIFLNYPKNLSNWSSLFWAQEEMDEAELNKFIVDEAKRRIAGEQTDTVYEGFMIRERSKQSPSFWQRLTGFGGN